MLAEEFTEGALADWMVIWNREFLLFVDANYYAFELSLLTLIMPCKIIAFTAHNWLTKRDYTYSLDDMCDIGIATCVAIWVYLIESWSQLPKPEDPSLAATVTGDFENYCYWFIVKNYEHSFRFLVFLAVMITFIWVRFLLMLQLTKSFGPMLRIILTMIGEMIKFLVALPTMVNH